MKALPTIAVGMLMAFLALLPLVSIAAATTVTVTPSPTNPSGAAAMTITGTVSPAPGAGVNAFIQVLNPAGKTVASTVAAVDPTAGTFTYSFTTGGTALWTTGTYTVTANAAGVSGSNTFTYTCTGTSCGAGTTGTSAVTLVLWAAATSPVYAGQTVQVSAVLAWTNGTQVTTATFKAWYIAPSGTATALSGAPTAVAATGSYWWSIPVSSSAADGLYAVLLQATVPTTTPTITWAQTGYTVNSGIASSAGLSTITTNLGTIGSTLTTMQTTVNSLPAQITQALAPLSSSLTDIKTAAAQIGTIGPNVTTTLSAVQSSQTYVLVVAALAAITLVLELAILVRKLS